MNKKTDKSIALVWIERQRPEEREVKPILQSFRDGFRFALAILL